MYCQQSEMSSPTSCLKVGFGGGDGGKLIWNTEKLGKASESRKRLFFTLL